LKILAAVPTKAQVGFKLQYITCLVSAIHLNSMKSDGYFRDLKNQIMLCVYNLTQFISASAVSVTDAMFVLFITN